MIFLKSSIILTGDDQSPTKAWAALFSLGQIARKLGLHTGNVRHFPACDSFPVVQVPLPWNAQRNVVASPQCSVLLDVILPRRGQWLFSLYRYPAEVTAVYSPLQDRRFHNRHGRFSNRRWYRYHRSLPLDHPDRLLGPYRDAAVERQIPNPLTGWRTNNMFQPLYGPRDRDHYGVVYRSVLLDPDFTPGQEGDITIANIAACLHDHVALVTLFEQVRRTIPDLEVQYSDPANYGRYLPGGQKRSLAGTFQVDQLLQDRAESARRQEFKALLLAQYGTENPKFPPSKSCAAECAFLQFLRSLSGPPAADTTAAVSEAAAPDEAAIAVL